MTHDAQSTDLWLGDLSDITVVAVQGMMQGTEGRTHDVTECYAPSIESQRYLYTSNSMSSPNSVDKTRISTLGTAVQILYGTGVWKIISSHHQQEQHHHDHFPTAYGKGQSNVVEASDVLRQILNQKIPHHTDGLPKKVIAQYEIPSDSNPPPFKPIKGGYLPPRIYGVPAGPIDSVTHSHSITTSFGTGSGYPKLLSATHVESEPGLPSSYDIYRSMALKHHGDKTHHHDSLVNPRSREVSHSASGVSYELLPPKLSSSGELVHEQQLRDLTKHLGNGIEVQKSLAYEIADPSATHLHHKRRSDETTDTTTDQDDAKPQNSDYSKIVVG
uniref:Zasp-like motif domain-containing protein n=1 Tax=Anopheles culicifacies TaxID=139723 RepID=A0A182M507_9DIPT